MTQTLFSRILCTLIYSLVICLPFKLSTVFIVFVRFSEF